MKTFIYAFCLAPFILLSNGVKSQITSIADGDWDDYATWGTNPPVSGDDVIINHNVSKFHPGYSPYVGWHIFEGSSITINSTSVLHVIGQFRGCVFINYGTHFGNLEFYDEYNSYSGNVTAN